MKLETHEDYIEYEMEQLPGKSVEDLANELANVKWLNRVLRKKSTEEYIELKKSHKYDITNTFLNGFTAGVLTSTILAMIML